MKKVSTLIYIAGLQLFAVAVSVAQTKSAANTLPAPPSGIKVDGEVAEWTTDTLHYYNAESKLNYGLANDAENIYIAIRINDVTEQKRVLGAGITFTFDPKGKKKSTYTVTFPIPQTSTNGLQAQMPQDEKLLAGLTKLRQIKVTGFPEIESDVMSLTNSYGFRVAIKYDNAGYLIYEASVPLKFFGDAKSGKDAWSFNFKVNGLPYPDIDKYDKSGTAGARSRDRNVRMPAGTVDHPELFKSVDFWEKYYLNQ